MRKGHLIWENVFFFLQNDFMEKLVPIYRKATESELQLAGGSWKYGSFMTTLLTQPDMYVKWGRKMFVFKIIRYYISLASRDKTQI